jgi:hypothetical protein
MAISHHFHVGEFEMTPLDTTAHAHTYILDTTAQAHTYIDSSWNN